MQRKDRRDAPRGAPRQTMVGTSQLGKEMETLKISNLRKMCICQAH